MKYILLIFAIVTVSFAQASDLQKDPEALARAKKERYRELAGTMHLEGGHRVGDLTVFRTLDVQPNWTFEGLDTFLSLRNLNLEKSSLRNLPKALTRLNMLDELDLSYNPLYQLPDWIGNFTLLNTLILIGIRLRDDGLPQTVCKLNNLLHLDVSENDLSIVPQTIASIPSLEMLDLSRNNLKSLPASLGGLPLRTLYLHDNYLKDLPPEFSRLTSLQAVWLQRNDLKLTPSILLNLSGLVSVHLENNMRLVKDRCYFALENKGILNLPTDRSDKSHADQHQPVSKIIPEDKEIPSFEFCSEDASMDSTDVIASRKEFSYEESVSDVAEVLKYLVKHPTDRLIFAVAAAEVKEVPAPEAIAIVLRLLRLDEKTVQAMMEHMNDRQ